MEASTPLILVGDDEFAQYQPEFFLLCDRLAVCEEIREGWFSDEALMVDMFDFVTTAEEMDAAVAALELPNVVATTKLLSALKAVRQYWTLQ